MVKDFKCEYIPDCKKKKIYVVKRKGRIMDEVDLCNEDCEDYHPIARPTKEQ